MYSFILEMRWSFGNKYWWDSQLRRPIIEGISGLLCAHIRTCEEPFVVGVIVADNENLLEVVFAVTHLDVVELYEIFWYRFMNSWAERAR